MQLQLALAHLQPMHSGVVAPHMSSHVTVPVGFARDKQVHNMSLMDGEMKHADVVRSDE